MGKVKDQKGDLAKQFPEISANIREHFGKEAFSEDDVRHAYCFCMRVPRKQTQLLSELHFALVSPSVIRMLPADFGAISRIDKDYPNVKAHARPCVCTKQALAHMARLSSRRYTCAYVSMCVPSASVSQCWQIALVLNIYLGSGGTRTETRRVVNGIAKARVSQRGCTISLLAVTYRSVQPRVFDWACLGASWPRRGHPTVRIAVETRRD